MIGSCDAELFFVHPDARDYHYAGPTATWGDWIDDYKMTGEVGRLKRIRRPGEPWAWTYAPRNQAPAVWAGVDTAGNVLCVWEAEENHLQSFCPIYPTGPTGKAVLPAGGAFVRVILPDCVTEIEALLAAASPPAWVAGTLEAQFDAAGLAAYQWESMQMTRGLELTDIRTALDGAAPLSWKLMQLLLYLRAASQVLYDHRGETCIPLIRAHFLVDPESGAGVWKD